MSHMYFLHIEMSPANEKRIPAPEREADLTYGALRCADDAAN